MATAVLTFVIVGHDDHPIFEADLSRAEGREGVSPLMNLTDLLHSE